MEVVRIDDAGTGQECHRRVPRTPARPTPCGPRTERDTVLDILVIIATIVLFALVGLLIPGLERLGPRAADPVDRGSSEGAQP